MKKKLHLPAGHVGDDLKAMHKEIDAAKKRLGEVNDAETREYLNEPNEEPSTSVIAINSHFESKRRNH